MHFTPLLALAGVAAAAPFSLSNGFPNPSASALKAIYSQAGGTLPGGALPTSLPADAIQALQVIATNEIFEVAYFTSLLNNVTNDVSGYTDLGSYSKSYIVDTLTAIRAQEELHAIGANAILASAGAPTIGPCNYMFPVKTYKTAVALAATFTDLVVGTLASVQKEFALDGGQAASGLVSLIGSIIGQESEQIGGFRVFQSKVPSESPFLTSGAGALAFSAVDQMFIVPGSCAASSNVSDIGITPFKTLRLADCNMMPKPEDATLKFVTSAKVSSSSNYIAYVSGQGLPVVRPISNIKSLGSNYEFSAHFPFAAGFSKGLTIAAIVNSKGPFADVSAVTNATIAGPGLIEID